MYTQHPTPTDPSSTVPVADTAIVLTGAVAQGAFAAGALDVVTRDRIAVARVVATSAGALSGTLLAAGVHAGRPSDAARTLVELWTDSASWTTALAVSPRELARRRGISTSRKLYSLLRRTIAEFLPGAGIPIELRLVVTALAGDPDVRRRDGVTSYESVRRFSGADFDTVETRGRLFTAVTAAAAFPGLYAPVEIDGVGPCLDGGATNNAPIKHALDGAIRRVIVISNTPAVAAAPPHAGIPLAEHLVNVLIHERLYRDLREARTVNDQLAVLDDLVDRAVIGGGQLAAVKEALGWACRRRLEIVEIRPAAALRGGPFTGLADRELRVEYIDEGRRAAEAALGRARDALTHAVLVSAAW